MIQLSDTANHYNVAQEVVHHPPSSSFVTNDNDLHHMTAKSIHQPGVSQAGTGQSGPKNLSCTLWIWQPVDVFMLTLSDLKGEVKSHAWLKQQMILTQEAKNSK